MLHDRTAEAFLADLSRLPHANVTTVPFQLDSPVTADPVPDLEAMQIAVTSPASTLAVARTRASDDTSVVTPILDARWRDHVLVAGEVRTVRVLSQQDSPSLEIILVDDTGVLSVVFLGRRGVAGIDVGTRLEATGTVGVFHGRLAMLNPTYTLVVP